MVLAFQLNDGSKKKIPAIAWGNGTGGLSKMGQQTADLGATVLESGILHLDTAQGYGTEAETRQAVERSKISRDDVFITSKLSPAVDGKPDFAPGYDVVRDVKTNPEDIKRSVQTSIEKLGGPPDLLLIHTPYVPEKGKIGAFWTVLEDLVYDGTLKGTSLGISNFQPEHIEEVMSVARIKPACHRKLEVRGDLMIELEFHPYVLTQLQPILDTHSQHGIITEAYGPLTPVLRHKGGPLKPILEKIAKKHGVDEAAVLLRWTIQFGVVAVTSSKNEDRIKGFKDVYDFELSEEEMKEIEQAGRSVHYRYYDEHMGDNFPVPDLPDGGENGMVPTHNKKA